MGSVKYISGQFSNLPDYWVFFNAQKHSTYPTDFLRVSAQLMQQILGTDFGSISFFWAKMVQNR